MHGGEDTQGNCYDHLNPQETVYPMDRRLSCNKCFEYSCEENNYEYIFHIKITVFWDVMHVVE
jgi:hypothetical protein